MKILLKTTQSTVPVPFNYHEKMVGTLHKWIGDNDLHDDISLYSFSWLQGGRASGNALTFNRGAQMYISFYDECVMKRIISRILDNPEMFCGMSVADIKLVADPDVTKREVFYCYSPVFIKRQSADGSTRQFNYEDAEAGELMRETLLAKMRKAGLEEDETLTIRFDTSYPKKKLKLVRYHGIGNKASLCPVLISGKPETKLFAWNVGVGNCTGIGFGAIN